MAYRKTNHTLTLANHTLTVNGLDIEYDRDQPDLAQVIADVEGPDCNVSLVFQMRDPFQDGRTKLDLAPTEAGNDEDNAMLARALGITDLDDFENQLYRDLFAPLISFVREQFELCIERENAQQDADAEVNSTFQMAFGNGYNNRFCAVNKGFLDVTNERGDELAHFAIDDDLEQKLVTIAETYAEADVRRTVQVLALADEAKIDRELSRHGGPWLGY
ncbi:hypothetical protein [Marinobacterium mangrovicola]|uniref:Uncharacterized protein n=1 Tax=Marinobacterium mangrovicola TaxID=1476959 RepID=A0A4R1H421_9GAMM|nr:hypothetical protein [Marinobacterium mangrovicola]TCK16414.1 hypothetical protein CLV83_0122 [Marinobacterium mangrovicola]